MNQTQLNSIKFVINDIIRALINDKSVDFNFHTKTINYIYNFTYNNIYQFVTNFLNDCEKVYIVSKLLVKKNTSINNKYLSLNQKCTYIISQYIYFDIYIELKNLIYNPISLSF